MPEPFQIDIHLGSDDLETALRADVRSGLTSRPRTLAPKWFYDDLGSKLFDAITDLPEYYPTRCERSILVERAGEIARAARPSVLVELGSGTSAKTRILLDALGVAWFVPMDVSEWVLRQCGDSLMGAYPGLCVHAVVGDFERHLAKLPSPGGRRLVCFLGGTIGNLDPLGRAALLDDLATGLDPGDMLLLGTDLVKEPARLVAAYDDPTGVTAAFNRNVLNVVNRRLGANFDLTRWEHVARWDPDNAWIEMHLRSASDQRVRVDSLDLTLEIEDGETIRTEISAKFSRQVVESELAEAGFDLQQWWTDS
ncbi:MAG: L-histidine N(alpha)-methyltransferase, partial [Acidimicrobiales bacterium]